jgi:hypothetical protein
MDARQVATVAQVVQRSGLLIHSHPDVPGVLYAFGLSTNTPTMFRVYGSVGRRTSVITTVSVHQERL